MSLQSALDPYQPGSSPLHKLDARVKLSLVLAFIFTAALVPHAAWVVYPILFSLVLSAALLTWLGYAHIFKRSLWSLPFVFAALPLLFTLPGEPLLQTRIAGFTLTISAAGLERFISIALKSWFSIQAAVVLVVTTPFPEITRALRWMKVPRLLVAVISLMWRYLFVFVSEAGRLIQARSARSSSLPGYPAGGRLAWRAKIAGGMAGNLFLRALERSERVYAAMLARGYDGDVRLLTRQPPTGRQVLLIAAFLFLDLFIILLSLISGGP